MSLPIGAWGKTCVAFMTFNVVANYDNPTPVFSVIPLSLKTRGCKFISATQYLDVRGRIDVVYQLDNECLVSVRAHTTAVQFSFDRGRAPLQPFGFIGIAPNDRRVLQSVLLHELSSSGVDPGQDQGSLPGSIEFQTAVWAQGTG